MRMIKVTACDGNEAWLNVDAIEAVCHYHDGSAVKMASGNLTIGLDRSEADRLLELLGALPGAAETAEAVPRGSGEPMCSCLNDDQLAAVMRSQGFMPCENKPGHWYWPPDDRIIAFPTAATNTALVSGSGATAGKRAWSYHAVFRLPDGSKAERLNVHLSKLCETLRSANVEWWRDM